MLGAYPDVLPQATCSQALLQLCRRWERNWFVKTMATPMLRARQALRIIDRFERVTAESRRATQENIAAGAPGESLESDSQGFNNSLPEQASHDELEHKQGPTSQRSLQRPPSHTTVDIPELATRDSARVRITPCRCFIFRKVHEEAASSGHLHQP